MTTPSANQRLTADELLELDGCCDLFEALCAAGAAPRCEDHAAPLSPRVRPRALAELFALEVQYRGGASRDSVLARPGLASLLEDLGTTPEALLREVPAADLESTVPRPGPEPAASGALRVRCPHCHNGVELLPDAPLDSITCRSCGSAFGLVDDPLRPGATPPKVGRFELVERLGVGGFGAVWRARDPELHREVALKLPRRGQLGSAELELFLREARAAAQLSHPHVVPVHEVGRDGDRVFIVSELVRGETLAERLRTLRPTPREAAELLATICEAVDYAHSRGVVHRDLKPSNVMIDGEGRPHVLDFGLAKRDVGEVTMTLEGQVLGTPAYMSPEQAGGMTRWIDRRTDVYSLGVMLFQMISGELPFRGTAQSQVQQRLEGDAPDPRRFDPLAPADLATICLKCLERNPGARYPTAGEVAAELRRYLRGEPVVARPISRFARALRWAKRRPALAVALALGAILAVAGPTAAVVIATQRSRLADRLAERDEVVRRDEAEIDRLGMEKDALRAELAGADAAPPTWRAKVARAFLDRHGDRLAAGGPDRDTRVALARLYTLAGDERRAAEIVAALVADESSVSAALPADLIELVRRRGDAALAADAEARALREAAGGDGPADVAGLVDRLPTDAARLGEVTRMLGGGD